MAVDVAARSTEMVPTVAARTAESVVIDGTRTAGSVVTDAGWTAEVVPGVAGRTAGVAVSIPETVAVAGREVGVHRPLALAALPLVVGLLWHLVVRRPEAGTADRRTRRALFASRVVIATLLVVAAAGPYTVATREASGDPTVTMLVDESASMAVQPDVAADLAAGIEAEGVRVERTTVADGNRSRLGDAVVANARENGSLLVVSDGRVTGGRDLGVAAETAVRLNTSVNAVALEADRTERSVTVDGPETTSVGVRTRFRVSVRGTVVESAPAELVVSVDDAVVARENVSGTGATTVVHNFSSPGTHRVTARLVTDDRYAVNDVSRATVDVVEKPRVLYVSRGEYPLEGYLSRLYDVTATRAVPDDLSPYYAVVTQNLPARAAGNTTALQRFVLRGNGLMIVGGDRAFEGGGYSRSPLGAMAPVRVGDRDGQRSRIVLTVDISGSAAGGMETQKALALDVLNQLGDRHVVGIVAFDGEAYRVADPRRLGAAREDLERTIRSLESGGRTSIASGLSGAGEMLAGASGTVILVSDGRANRQRAVATARTLGERDVRVVSIGVGDHVDEELLVAVADASGGSYLRANGTSRLRVRFGDPDETVGAGSLVVTDRSHFVTAGVRTEARPSFSNDVRPKRGASMLVATGTGDPAVTAWRYGTGRVVALTAYGTRNRLHGLLSHPDSLLVSRSVNWAIGDPRRKAERGTRVPDTRVDRRTTVVHHGAERPTAAGLSFSRVGEGRYEATLRPDRPGYHSVLGAEYAADYPAEYERFGRSRALERLVDATGGRTFDPDETDAVAEAVARQTRRVREVRTDRDWAALLAALVVFLGEVAARRRNEEIP